MKDESPPKKSEVEDPIYGDAEQRKRLVEGM